jgi:hypothetical protein
LTSESDEARAEKSVTDNDRQNQLTGIADDIWLVDAGTIDAAGLPLPVRMVVIRLGEWRSHPTFPDAVL